MVIYDNKKLIPAPFVNIVKNFNKGGNDVNVGSTFSITVNGSLVAFKGSPSASGTGAGWSNYFWTNTGYPPDEVMDSNARLESILRKQEALRNLFKTDGLWFEIQSDNGSLPVKFRPRISSLSFGEGVWYDRCEYSISMEADVLYIKNQIIGEDAFTEMIRDANESWNLDYDDNRQVFNLTHSISAQGKRVYNYDGSTSEAWEQARNWVLPKLGLDITKTGSGVWQAPQVGYNHIRSQSVDEQGGSFSVNESWILSNQNYIDEYVVNVQEDNQAPGLKSVSVQGTVTGLDTKDSNMNVTSSRYYAASGAFYGTVYPNLYSRALSLSNSSYVNSTPLSYSLGINKNLGTIEYTYSYNNRPMNCISGARFENISLVDNYASDIFALVPVLGRSAGPVIQDMATVSEKSRILTIEVTMTPPESCISKLNFTRPNYSGVIAALKPAGTVLVSQNQETFDLTNGVGSRVIGWVYQ